MMRLAKGWAWFVTPLLVLGGVFLLLGPYRGVFFTLGVASLVLGGLVALFFRDPHRRTASGIVAPADGRVQSVGDDGIVTFLNVHDVHVVRAPYSGRVTHVERFDGPHRPAFLPKAEKNAGVEIKLRTAWGPQTVRLVAGLVARRAVAWVQEGDAVEKGGRIGMIRFSSRVDATLPDGAQSAVHAGDRVRAGETTLAKEPPEGPA